MSPLVIVIVGSAVILLALLVLAVICACVLASRADDYLETAYEPQPVLAALDEIGTSVESAWTEEPANVIQFPARLRAL